MKLDQLIHWRLEGTPDVFTEERDGHLWKVIHSGGAVHHAGFSQVVYFEKPIKTALLSTIATLHTTGGGLMLRLGIHPSGLPPDWSGWFGPDNGWSGQKAQVLKLFAQDLDVYSISIFLESRCKWPVRTNTSRWRDVQLEVEYVDQEPEPEPDPKPDPDPPDPPETIQAMLKIMADVQRILDKMDQVLERFDLE